MIRSMTGFGAAAGPIGSQQVRSSWNGEPPLFQSEHQASGALSQWEGELREQLRKGVARGHVTATARSSAPRTTCRQSTSRRSARYAELLRGLQQRHGLDGPVDLATILRFPDVLASGQDQETAGTAAEVQKLAVEAIAALTHMRELEGARLAMLLEERISRGRGCAERIAQRAPERVVAQRDRLTKAVRELTDGVASGRAADSRRRSRCSPTGSTWRRSCIAFRVAHRGVSRERSRAVETEPVGKRLGFLLQEMLREANTTGSKANDAAMLQDVRDDQGGAGADSRAGGEPGMNAVPAHPVGAVGRRQDDDRADAARASRRPRLLGVLHDARAAGGRSGRAGLLFPDAGRVPRASASAASSPSRRRCTATCTARCAARSSACWRRAARDHGHRRAGRAAVPRALSGVGDCLRAAAVGRGAPDRLRGAPNGERSQSCSSTAFRAARSCRRWTEYEYVVVNDDLDRAVHAASASIIDAEVVSRERVHGLLARRSGRSDRAARSQRSNTHST